MTFLLRCGFVVLLAVSSFAVIAFLPLQEQRQENTGEGKREQVRKK